MNKDIQKALKQKQEDAVKMQKRIQQKKEKAARKAAADVKANDSPKE